MPSIPTTSEYAPFYATYIDKVGTEPVLDLLKNQLPQTLSLFEKLEERDFEYRYAKGKWTVAEVLLHMIDTEMVMLNRALYISRNDPTSLPGMDQELFVNNAHIAEIKPAALLNAYNAVRHTTLAMARLITPDQYLLVGNAWKYPVSVRALFYIIAGHEQHHMGILKKKYLHK